MSTSGLLRRLFPRPPDLAPWIAYDEATLTPLRLFNLHLMCWEQSRNRTRLMSRPVKLVIESTNVCNLECPGCFTGRGENGRARSHLSFDFFKQVMDEQASRLFQVEFYNWGEPLLNKQVIAMVEEANRRGLATVINTNFSLPFDAERAEALVRSGLTNLGVSIDGATQATYEIYRRGGDLAQVFRNVRLVADAKQRLGSKTPQIMWGWHTFKHNLHEEETARAMAPSLGFDSFHPHKAWQIGEDWNGPGDYAATPLQPFRCWFLWQYAVIHNDGGVAPCCATFHHEDDVGKLAVKPGAPGRRRFAEVWNSPEMIGARAYFDPRTRLGDETDVCRNCPATLNWRAFLEAGADRETYKSAFAENALPTYMAGRRPAGRDTRKLIRKAS